MPRGLELRGAGSGRGSGGRLELPELLELRRAYRVFNDQLTDGGPSSTPELRRCVAFGRMGLESASHPLGNFDMFQEVSPLSSRPGFISARAALGWPWWPAE
jgi:hypothetical protein